ncbi:hypothetical protein Dtox_1115 [Desulfofarcimen acetoxidans DSM 771]|uniref:Alkaline phosphatase n=1 Tax=Desulfofarcimen acetoxidans (strain ATCC 49208 / DSM 771 / KCTC 5769 / VKM B-1644 / 5575) TaxID=485916 RepID=C8W4D3_DESAS|nr:hypothetical protein [Desulfofarcimen acetoxidans]ACV62001.1 hypothetical protein Dtox_1115 [Desulfofarcimen acetoxidans DSM 771]
MKKLRRIIFALLLTVIFLFMVTPGISLAAEREGKFYLILINYLSLEDLQNSKLTNINKMIENGGLGLMNTNTAGSRSAENTYSTLGSGTRALGTDYGGFAYNREETVSLSSNLSPLPAGDIYNVISNQDKKGEVIHLALPKIVLANQQLTNKVKTAALGTSLKNAGIRVGVFGNSDSFARSRPASLLAIDEQGQVAKGVVDSSINMKDKAFPFGFHTDYDKLKNEVVKNHDKVDFFVIETGDNSRLEDYKTFLTSERYNQLKELTLNRIDGFLGALSNNIDWQKDRVMLVSPTPSSKASTFNNLVTPLIYAGNSIHPGVLTSSSTRRQGIVAITDITPTVLSFWGIKQDPEIVGRPVFSQTAHNVFQQVKQLNQNLIINYTHRPPVLKTFVILQIIYILLTAFSVYFLKSHRVLQPLQKLIVLFLIMPPVILAYSIFRVESLALTLIYFALIVALIYLVISKANISFYYKVAFLSLSTSAAILIDTVLGSPLTINSPLGYDAMNGARYYGIGNEFAGILEGSTIIGTAALYQELSKHRRILLPVFLAYFAFMTYVSYAPGFGADAGGLITAVIALGFFSLRLMDKRVSRRELLYLLLLTLLLLGLGAFIDMTFNSLHGSHIGQAFSLLVQGNYAEIGNIIYRKIAMNIKLMNYSIWTKVLLASLAALGVLLYKPVGFFKQLTDSVPNMKKGFEAIFVASLVGFLVNDSGIVQAATTFIYLIFPLLYLSLQDKLNRPW